MKTKFKFKFKLVIAKMAMTGCGMNNSSFAQTFVKPPGRNGNTTNTPAAVGVGASLALALHPALGAGLNYPTGSGSRFFETGAGSFFRNTC
ncbi:MAG: hypothetical protein LBR10_01405, partial [Prevotellaceae bacterium]|nr:hypothetical protein [Prevotellaceae bacterium]